MIFPFIAAAAVAAQDPAPCPDAQTEPAAICRALNAQQAGEPAEAAADFEQAAQLSKSDVAARAWAAAGNLWIAAGDSAKASADLDHALEGTALSGTQRGEALLDRGRAAADQGDLKTARANVTEAAQTISQDPFLWYFSAALAIREGDAATAKSSIDKALDLVPNDPSMLFEAGHVAEFSGDDVGARDYWTRAVAADPNSDAGKAAQRALDIIGPALTVKMDDTPPK